MPSKPGIDRGKQTAELHLKKGKRFLYRGAVTRAVDELEKAFSHDPDSEVLELYAKWAHFMVSPGTPEQAQQTEKDLLSLAGRTVSDDRGFGFGHYVLGQLALREGRNRDAVRALGHAVKLDPSNQDAKRGHEIAKRRAGK